jgi:hypothetical protein
MNRADEILDRIRYLIYEDGASATRLGAKYTALQTEQDWVRLTTHGIERLYLWDEVLRDYMGFQGGLLGDAPLLPPEYQYPESFPFRPGGSYAYLEDPVGEGWEVLKQPVLKVDSNKTAEIITWETSEWEGRKYLGNSANSSWGERGPKWGWRRYNLQGLIKDLIVWRIGDFHQGREGHGIYANVYGDLTIADSSFDQCGAQALQLVWRPKETLVPQGDWPDASRTITLDEVHATDCGVINKGSQVRASWPFAIYSPGQNIRIEGCSNACNIASFYIPGKNGTFRSHGSLIVSPAQTYRRTQLVEVDGFTSTVERPVKIKIRAKDKPWGAPVREESWDGSGTKEIVP